jgi:hypothetical protein
MTVQSLHPFGLSLSKPIIERSEMPSLCSGVPFDFAQGERSIGGKEY